MSGFLERAGPRWFTIPAHRPFVQDLARGLIDALADGGPEALSQATVLTPTRRGARALADAFLAEAASSEFGGRAVLPPQMRPLGDLEEGEPPFEPGDLALDLPPAIEPLRRRFELTRLVTELAHLAPGGLRTAAGALDLADALGRFFDGLQIEEADIAGAVSGALADLAPGAFAEHWEVSRAFLEQALALWPQRLAEMGVVDVSERRVRLLRRLAELWAEAPPPGVLVAAGSTGTAPATRALLTAIAAAPQGCVVLPGLDQDLADKAWAKVDVQHPQGALKRLLDEAGIAKREVAVWPASRRERPQERWRRRIVNEALRPAQETADWLHVIKTLEAERPDAVAEGLSGLSLVSARTEEEAATAAALLLREALETPERTAALVTPDQALARRVSAKLMRWGVTPDSSTGESLGASPCGALAGLLARAAVDPVDPVVLLGLAKHRFSRMGDPWALERHALRGPRARTWPEIRKRLERRGAEALPLATRLEALVMGLAWTAETEPPCDAARRLTEAMEALAADERGHTGELWAGHAGEAMARILAGLIADGGRLPQVTARQFADLLQRLLEGETVRVGGATHPRLRILGSIEARLVRADRLVLAGLEEGVWPAAAATDPFLSRPMREALGLPSPERRIGLSAHDFAQAACAPEVVLLHTERRDGAPSVKSRWLWRLETLAKGAGLAIPERREVLDWAAALDAPGTYEPVSRPAPTPPVVDRPRKLYVTRIETLTRDPYAVWARDILGLRVLERPDEEVEARARGTAIHKAFERFVLDWPGDLPPDAAPIFRGLYLEELERAGMPRDALARETALAAEAAAWVAELEAHRRADGRVLHVETEGQITLEIAGRPFTLAAKADRIEVSPDGLGHVLDYKTGRAPTARMVKTGFSPQLTLTAAIMAAGGFAEVGRIAPGELTYLEVTGRKPPGREEVRAAPDGDNEDVLNSRDAADQALTGMARLVARFTDPAQGYASRTAPQFVKLYVSDYDHLARVFEWSTSGEDDE